ncbi:MAG: EAL domain-containing protein [Sulfuricella sp.]|nr:EAL domain-containing protein [Sulfuricella sp.]
MTLNLKLTAKLNLLSVTMIVATAMGIALFLVRQEIADSRRELHSQGKIVSSMLADNSEYAVYTANRESLGQIIQNLSQQPDVAYAAILDGNRKGLAERMFRSAGAVPPLPAYRFRENLWVADFTDPASGRRYLDFLVPVMGTAAPALAASPLGTLEKGTRRDVIGYVRLGMSQERMHAYIREFLVTTLIFTSILVVFGTLVTVLITRRIVAPIRNVAAIAQEIAGGQLGRRMTISSRDEISDLALSFNQMIDHLQEYQGQVEDYRHTLEEKVEQRTRQLKESTEHAFRLAQHDMLTGLPNRAMLTEHLHQALAHASRHERRVAVLFIDLDRFKNINDALGHDTGDILLKSAAARLLGSVRESDTVARLGGDEFVVVLPDADGERDATAVAHKILDALSNPFELTGKEFNISGSIGISLYPEDGSDSTSLVKNADTAMYNAKGSGRNTYRFYTPDMNVRVMERLKMENNLRRGLERDEFFLLYQPQVDIASGAVLGLEALSRWNQPDEGLISPAHFIPVAEESGLILPFGEWVLRTACAQTRRWLDQGIDPGRVAVNFSMRQFEQQNPAHLVAQILRETGLDARHLELELTETLISHHPDQAIATLAALREMGVEISIDDFGTGYSSLSYLTRFPIHKIKIDRSFILGIGKDPSDEAVINAIIAMARSLGLTTIAEGVESEEQLAFLRAHDCDQIQGFLFSQPLSAEKAAQFIGAA